MTINEMARLLSATFLEAVKSGVDGKISELVLNHAGYQTEEELMLLGVQVKYACLNGLNVHVVGKQ